MSNVFHKNYQARKLFKDILYIPGGWDHERIELAAIFICLATIIEASLG